MSPGREKATTRTNSANFFIDVPVSGAPGVPARPRCSQLRPNPSGLARRVCVATPRAAKSGPRYPSREAAPQESPARQCRGANVEQNRVPEGRHISCDTFSGLPLLHRIMHHALPLWTIDVGGLSVKYFC